MKNIKNIILTGLAVMFTSFMFAQSANAVDVSKSNSKQLSSTTNNNLKGVAVNQRTNNHEATPKGGKQYLGNGKETFANATEMKSGRHHHKGHKHHKHHKNDGTHKGNAHRIGHKIKK